MTNGMIVKINGVIKIKNEVKLKILTHKILYDIRNEQLIMSLLNCPEHIES